MKITVRKLRESDIDLKIKWINNEKNNQYLHYELPLEKNKTIEWFNKIKENHYRYDGIIEFSGIAVGLIGLLSITNKKAEYYILLGEEEYKRKGIAKKASLELLNKAFFDYQVEYVYLYTECENKIAQKLFEKLGFKIEGVEKNKVLNRGKYVDRFYYILSKEDYFKNVFPTFNTPLYQFEKGDNNYFIKRDDLIPFSFGGNKARKAFLFFEEITKGNYDCVVTYGSSSSNHCRIISNLAMKHNISCYIISPEEGFKNTYNNKLIKILGAKIILTSIEFVHETIDNTLNTLKNEGHNPYFIEGGGHGNIGTQAMVGCYKEIYEFERLNNLKFDYIFFASGTGTTQAGLLSGKLLFCDEAKLIGISIARKIPRGRNIIIESIKNYLNSICIKYSDDFIEHETEFVDSYIEGQYGLSSREIFESIKHVFCEYGIPLDSTYTGKAFLGMLHYVKEKKIKDKNILFLHTGGTPLFFNDLEEV